MLSSLNFSRLRTKTKHGYMHRRARAQRWLCAAAKTLCPICHSWLLGFNNCPFISVMYVLRIKQHETKMPATNIFGRLRTKIKHGFYKLLQQ